MAVRATFTGFESYNLTGVTVTDRELGHGSYATVLELDYMGLKCAGKKTHELLLRQGNTSYTVRRFEEECRLLSQVRHPNIVQFLGVHFQKGVPTPLLVMEFLPTNLTSCIEQYGVLPKEISYSILHDVALGLCYLHSQTPPIIHRDLSSNNVLLTANMTAKISDLGVARILNLTPLQVSCMTQTPGTPAYMPPEVMIADPKYNRSVDQFSYGVMMIHMFSGRWPEPQVGPSRFEANKLIPVTEAERREVFVRAIGNDHPLMDLILKCINNNPRHRAHASKIVERLSAMKSQFPSSFANRLEMLRHIEHQKEEKRELREKGEAESQRKEQQISTLRKEAEEKEEENVRLTLVYSSEVEQIKPQLQDLNSQKQRLVAKNDADLANFMTTIASCKDQIEFYQRLVQQEREQFMTQLTMEREEHSKQMESYCHVTKENIKLKATISESMTNSNSLKQQISSLSAELLRKDAEIATKALEIKANARTIEEKDAVISGMDQQLIRIREHLSSKQQVMCS